MDRQSEVSLRLIDLLLSAHCATDAKLNSGLGGAGISSAIVLDQIGRAVVSTLVGEDLVEDFLLHLGGVFLLPLHLHLLLDALVREVWLSELRLFDLFLFVLGLLLDHQALAPQSRVQLLNLILVSLLVGLVLMLLGDFLLTLVRLGLHLLLLGRGAIAILCPRVRLLLLP